MVDRMLFLFLFLLLLLSLLLLLCCCCLVLLLLFCVSVLGGGLGTTVQYDECGEHGGGAAHLSGDFTGSRRSVSARLTKKLLRKLCNAPKKKCTDSEVT